LSEDNFPVKRGLYVYPILSEVSIIHFLRGVALLVPAGFKPELRKKRIHAWLRFRRLEHIFRFAVFQLNGEEFPHLDGSKRLAAAWNPIGDRDVIGNIGEQEQAYRHRKQAEAKQLHHDTIILPGCRTAALPAGGVNYGFMLQFIRRLRVLPASLLFLLPCAPVRAQGNYEVQVYGAEMVPPERTMVELHSNFTFEGSKTEVDGVRPDEHALHETIEITQGFTPWFETGFYIFMSYRAGEGYQWVGDHIRPRVRVPEAWHWPVNVSLSTEIGYQRRSYSPDSWTWEIRPIADKQLGRWYLAVNPALERSFHGASVSEGVGFSPAAKVSYDVTKKVTLGFEYYGSVGALTGFYALGDQQQAIMPALDLNLGPNWEFNLAAGIGLTGSTDHMLVKMIIGRRLKFGQR